MKTDLDALRARLLHPKLTAEEFESILALLAYIDELEREIAELKARITTLEAMKP